MWGFTPKVLAYMPTVRGVVTGLADPPVERGSASRAPVQPAAATPLDTLASIPSTAISSNVLAGLRTQVEHVPLLCAFPGVPAALDQLPMLRFLADDSRQAASANQARVIENSAGASSTGSVKPRWGWSTTFLGSLTATLRKEVVGVTPDGLRINWHVTKGSFVGPDFEAVVLPGAADWMRIRRDGVAIVSVQACFETKTGVRVYGSYSGIFDLGPDGFARAQRDEFDELPPVIVTPTYATAAPEMEWMNRAQCVGVGRVDMNAVRVEFDVYLVRVGTRLPG